MDTWGRLIDQEEEVLCTFDIRSLWLTSQSLEAQIAHFCHLNDVPVDGDDREDVHHPAPDAEMEATSPPHVAVEDEDLPLPLPSSVAVQEPVVPSEQTTGFHIVESNLPKVTDDVLALVVSNVPTAPDAVLAPVLAELAKLKEALETQSHTIAAIQQEAAESKKELSNSVLKVRDDLVSMNDHLTQRLTNLENNFTADVQAREAEHKELADVSFRLTTLENNFTAEVDSSKAARERLTELSSRLTSNAEIVDGIVKAIPVDDARLNKVE